jgi:hypothetical protein
MRLRVNERPWLLLSVVAACQVQSDVFYQRTYYCDRSEIADMCGTTRGGAPMTCYKTRQLGGRDFCAERCQPGEAEVGLAGQGWRCVDGSARLVTCRPSLGRTGCPPDTDCLRTDALEDEGVCATIPTCSEDADCQDPARPSCMGPLVGKTYGPAGVRTDHYSCLQTGCRARLSACAPSESCLPNVVPFGTNPSDICVPNCDGDLNCPPNYFCFRKVSGAGAPAVCIPGLMGYRCITDMDCLLGNCVDGGDGFKLCAVPCQTGADCDRFGVALGGFLCAADPGGRGRYCQNPRAYAGSPCTSDEQCQPRQSCVTLSPYFEAPMVGGECRNRCSPAEPCKHRGGIPHACVELGATRTCYPGRLHVPCEADADCVGDLRCLEVVSLDLQDQLGRRKRCSAPCETDADCDRARWAEKNAYCLEGTCSARRTKGMRCDRDPQCLSGRCLPDPEEKTVTLCQ